MNKYQIVFTEKADDDLEAIAEYISLDNPEKAIEYAIELQEKIKKVL